MIPSKKNVAAMRFAWFTLETYFSLVASLTTLALDELFRHRALITTYKAMTKHYGSLLSPGD